MEKKLFDKSQFLTDEPRYIFACFINELISENYEKAMEFTQLTWRDTTKDALNWLYQYFGSVNIVECVYIKHSDMRKNKALDKRVWRDVVFLLHIVMPDNILIKQKMSARLCKEDGSRSTSIYGRWGVNPLSATKKIERIY